MKFIILAILSVVITRCITIVFTGSSDPEHVKEVVFKITPKEGILGCLSKEKYGEAQGYYATKELDKIQKMLADRICFLFSQGEEVKAAEGVCGKEKNDDDLEAFASKKIFLVKPYIPCYAVR